ncbi:hypothetical protein [Labrys okinawensis]|nr:hypothetical protein [Labrys okinawensis]
MTTSALSRSPAARPLSTRIWAAFSGFLMKMAQADIRAGSREPFGL